MSEQVPPNGESDDQEQQDQHAQPEVPLAGDFEVQIVVKLPEDPDERRKVREEFGARPQARMDLTDTSIDRPAASRGHKGRGGKRSE